MKEILKWPLIIAAVVIVLRVLTERAGAPDSFNNLLSVVVLHTVLAPIYFAVRIAKKGMPQPYRTLFKLIGIYVVVTRIMLLPTYWLARIFEWTDPRFYGLRGPDVTPFYGYFTLPFLTAGFWIVASLTFGGVVGSIALAIGRRLVGPVPAN